LLWGQDWHFLHWQSSVGGRVRQSGFSLTTDKGVVK